MPAPPRAPTFPAFIDEVREVDDTSFVTPSAKLPPTDAPSPLVDMSSTAAAPADVPVVPLPVASSRSRVKAVLLWKDPKLSGIVFGVCMAFFYLTLWVGLSVMSVIGMLSAAYFALGFVVVLGNKKAGGKLDTYLKRPVAGTPLLRRDVLYRGVDKLVEEVNEVGEDIRDVLYCEKPGLTAVCFAASMVVYWVGKYCPVLVVFLALTILAFSLPLAYDKNKKQVDDMVAKGMDVANKQIGVVGEKAMMYSDKAGSYVGQQWEKAPPGLKNLGAKVGLGTKKTQ